MKVDSTFLTEVYNTTSYNAYNFAMGGSTVDSRVVKPYLAGTSLFDQMRDFFRWYGTDAPKMPWKSDDTLFIFWFGVNDIALTHGRSRQTELLDDHRRPPMPEIFASYGNLVTQVSSIPCVQFATGAFPRRKSCFVAQPLPLRDWDYHCPSVPQLCYHGRARM